MKVALFFKHNNLLTTIATTTTTSIRVKCCKCEKRMFEKHSPFSLFAPKQREREKMNEGIKLNLNLNETKIN